MNARVGPYLLRRPLYQGGMALVWEAVEARGGEAARHVALKTVPAASADREELAEALRAEAGLLGRLAHPNLISMLACGELPAEVDAPLLAGAPWLATPLARPGPLTSRVGRLPWSLTRRLLRQVLLALDHLHGQGLLHLDVKPSNLLLDGSDRLLLCDLGLARPPGGEAPPLAWGTPSYMAPEQLAEPAEPPTERTDLYSAGCVAWALISGRPPYGRAPEEACVGHLHGTLPSLTSAVPLPDGVERWLRRMLERDPARRPASAREALDGLARLEGGRPRPRARREDAPPCEAPLPTLRLGKG